MTDNEIIKALEYCKDCSANLNVEIIDLITRQQAENDTLKNVIKNSFLKKAGCNIDPLAEIKSKAVKEFAERLKRELTTGKVLMRISVLNIIDNLLKEMEDNNND